MQTKSSSQSGIFNLRLVLAVLLCAFGASLGWLSFAASPSGGTITPSGPTLTWTGTGNGVPPAVGGESDCEQGANCDAFKLTISGTPADWVAAGKQVKVRIEWLLNSSDYDLNVHKGSLDGPVIASSGAWR